MAKVINCHLVHILRQLSNTGSLVQVKIVSDLFILLRGAFDPLWLWTDHLLHAELPHQLEYIVGQLLQLYYLLSGVLPRLEVNVIEEPFHCGALALAVLHLFFLGEFLLLLVGHEVRSSFVVEEVVGLATRAWFAR